ncbi:mannosyltransferase YkcB-related protein [Streptomyces caelestis]
MTSATEGQLRTAAPPSPPPGERAAPRWSLPMLLAILALAAVLYSWNLSGSSLNSFYSAAVLSGTQSWKAWFFGSLDAGNFLTVDGQRLRRARGRGRGWWRPGLPGRRLPGWRGAPPGGQNGQSGQAPGGTSGSGASARPGGLGGGADSELVSYLKKHQDGTKWLLAVSSSQSAAQFIVSSGEPVISMWGWSGSDKAMTLAKLKELVKKGELHYVQLGGGMGGGPGGDSSLSSEVTAWVQKHGTAVKSTLYL